MFSALVATLEYFNGPWSFANTLSGIERIQASSALRLSCSAAAVELLLFAGVDF